MPHGGPSLPRHPSPSTLSRIQRPQGAGIRSLDVTKFEVCVGRLLDGHEGKSPSSKPLAQFQQPDFGFASLPARPCLPDCGAHRQSQRRRPRQVQGRKQERRRRCKHGQSGRTQDDTCTVARCGRCPPPRDCSVVASQARGAKQAEGAMAGDAATVCRPPAAGSDAH